VSSCLSSCVSISDHVASTLVEVTLTCTRRTPRQHMIEPPKLNAYSRVFSRYSCESETKMVSISAEKAEKVSPILAISRMSQISKAYVCRPASGYSVNWFLEWAMSKHYRQQVGPSHSSWRDPGTLCGYLAYITLD
jgi:hypothetical protein